MHIELITSRFLFFLVSLLISAPVWAKLPQGVIPLVFDENGITLEVVLPPFEIENLHTQEISCQTIHLPGWANTREVGYPQLPITAVFIQVPSLGNIRTQIIEETYASLSHRHICPVPKQLLSDEGQTVLQWSQAEVYRENAFYPPSPLELGTREMLRGVPVSRLKILPFKWSPLTQELRYLSRLQVRIEFEHPLDLVNLRSSDRTTIYETLLQETLINYTPHLSHQGQRTSEAGNPQRAEKLSLDTPDQVSHVRASPEPRKTSLADKLRFETSVQGIYRLSYDNLAKLGYLDLDTRTLRLFSRGEEIALHVISAQEEKWASKKDYLEFYAPEGPNIYWLQWRTKLPGQRMTETPGTLTGEGERVTSFDEQLHFEQNSEKWLETPRAPDQDYLFWQRLNAGENHDYTINIPSPDLEASAQAIMKIAFQGRSTASPHPNHHTLIKLNGTMIGDAFWDRDVPYVQEISFSPSLLQEGENTVAIEMPGDTGAIVDVVYFNWITLTYPRRLEAVNDSLWFTISHRGKVHIEVNHLTQSNLVLYDVTHPHRPIQVVNFTVTNDDGTHQIQFDDELLEPKTYYLTTQKKIKAPTKLVTWKPSMLKSSRNAADYILITTQSFLPVMELLLELRRQQGLRVKAVSVEDIYNEFNEGVIDVQAIKAFLTLAYQTWQPPAPTYVFLVGSAAQTADKSQVPTHLSASGDGLTPDDNWYVSVEGDDVLPEMLIGRVPGKDIKTITHVIEKIVRFERSSHSSPHRILLVADNDKENQFTQLNESLVNFLPPEFTADKIYLDTYFEKTKKDDAITQQVTKDIVSNINSGVMLSNYAGHGSVKQWSAKNVFNSETVQTLMNEEQLIFAMMLTCINGHFIAGNPSLAEWFLLAQAGAVGSFASSNLSYQWENQILSEEVFSNLFEKGERKLGVLTTQSKIAAYGKGMSEEAVQMYTLFGDPATTLKPW